MIKAGKSDQIPRIGVFSIYWLSRFFAKTGLRRLRVGPKAKKRGLRGT